MKSEDWLEYESVEHRILIHLNKVTMVCYEKQTGKCKVVTPTRTIVSGEHLYNEIKDYIENV